MHRSTDVSRPFILDATTERNEQLIIRNTFSLYERYCEHDEIITDFERDFSLAQSSRKPVVPKRSMLVARVARQSELNQTRRNAWMRDTREYTRDPRVEDPRSAWQLAWKSAARRRLQPRSTRRGERIYRGHRVYAARHSQDNHRLIGSLRLKRVCSIKKKLCRTGFFAARRIRCNKPAISGRAEGTLVGNPRRVSIRVIFVRSSVVNPRSKHARTSMYQPSSGLAIRRNEPVCRLKIRVVANGRRARRISRLPFAAARENRTDRTAYAVLQNRMRWIERWMAKSWIEPRNLALGAFLDSIRFDSFWPGASGSRPVGCRKPVASASSIKRSKID